MMIRRGVTRRCRGRRCRDKIETKISEDLHREFLGRAERKRVGEELQR